MTFINLKIFPSGVNTLGLHYMFWIHSAMCIFICIIAALVLPETRGKSLLELSELYQKKPVIKSKLKTSSATMAKMKEIEANMG